MQNPSLAPKTKKQKKQIYLTMLADENQNILCSLMSYFFAERERQECYFFAPLGHFFLDLPVSFKYAST